MFTFYNEGSVYQKKNKSFPYFFMGLFIIKTMSILIIGIIAVLNSKACSLSKHQFYYKEFQFLHYQKLVL